MPIRFRCPSCEGLLSIARRKAGTQIHCPRCEQEVMVPAPEVDAEPEIDLADESTTAEPVEPLANEVKPTHAVFDKPDFEQSLDAAFKSSSIPTANVMEIPSVPIETGIVITFKTALILGALFIGLMVLSFATGFLMGR